MQDIMTLKQNENDFIIYYGLFNAIYSHFDFEELRDDLFIVHSRYLVQSIYVFELIKLIWINEIRS